MATGTLKMWNAERGYGFIADDSGGPDIFLHIRALQSAGIDPDNRWAGKANPRPWIVALWIMLSANRIASRGFRITPGSLSDGRRRSRSSSGLPWSRASRAERGNANIYRC
jgi:'Cold-shock' DNA-binding domain